MILSAFSIRRSRQAPAKRRLAPAAIGVAVLLLLAAPALRASGPNPSSSPKLTYTKILKGSTPEYERIVVNSDGSGTYDGRRLAEPPNPQHFQLSSDVTARFFELAGRLNDFQNVSLESHKRVADLGRKTFTYTDGARTYECTFNYSTERTAVELTDLFEGLGAVERHIAALDYSMRYDRLGLPRELSLIQIDLENKSLLDPQLMTGTLESILHNPAYLHLAQVRAKDILRQIEKTN